MPTPLPDALDQIYTLLTDLDQLIKAIGSGKRRGFEPAPRIDLRPVDLKTGPHLQVVTNTDGGPITRNIPAAEVFTEVAELIAMPYGNWHVETLTETTQLRVTKKGDAQVHTTKTSGRSVAPRTHDRPKQRIIDSDDPLFSVLGAGADKRRQVDAFLRLAEPTIRTLGTTGPLHTVDLGCGNSYLSFAAHRWLSEQAPGSLTVGVELREDLVNQSTKRAKKADLPNLRFITGAIDQVALEDLGLPDNRVDVVMALHACDTATDDALAQAVRWQAPVILAAPCCHRNIQQQLGAAHNAPSGFNAVLDQPILRERFADVLTDGLRAAVLRTHGYRVDVVEFVDSRHTPRNAMIRAVKTDVAVGEADHAALQSLADAWGVAPVLGQELA